MNVYGTTIYASVICYLSNTPFIRISAKYLIAFDNLAIIANSLEGVHWSIWTLFPLNYVEDNFDQDSCIESTAVISCHL